MKYDDKELREALEIFGKSYIAELSDLLRKEDKVASGNLIKSLDTRVIKTAFGTLYTIQLIAEDYLQYVDGGRRPGKRPPIQAIRKWVRFKGIPQSVLSEDTLKGIALYPALYSFGSCSILIAIISLLLLSYYSSICQSLIEKLNPLPNHLHHLQTL